MDNFAILKGFSLDPIETRYAEFLHFTNLRQKQWEWKNDLTKEDFSPYFLDLVLKLERHTNLEFKRFTLLYSNDLHDRFLFYNVHRDIGRKTTIVIPLSKLVQPIHFYDDLQRKTQTLFYSETSPTLSNVSNYHNIDVGDTTAPLEEERELRILFQCDTDLTFKYVIRHNPQVWDIVQNV